MLLEKPEDVKHENPSGTGRFDRFVTKKRVVIFAIVANGLLILGSIIVCAIYGIDAHPTLQLAATAGGDNSVKIWSLQPVLDGGVASFELLATLSNHQQAVNCVRWAGHGRYLASGSDDRLVLLYELHTGAPAPVPFGSNAKPNKQNWVRCATLERHTMDVADVAWSPDDRMLATCSIDNSILIWDVSVGGLNEVMTQPLQTLTGHNGWVKGVAWDPVGKYLSSAGEDKTVRMWKVADWQEADIVTEPFEACASTSHFRRLSWSPDGSILCATHAFSSKKNIAALLNRGSWANDLKFVGHRGVVTSARFNPKLLGEEIGTPISDAQQSKILQTKLEEKSTILPRLDIVQHADVNAALIRGTQTTNTLIPKKKVGNVQVSITPQNRPSSEIDKKRIAPVLQTDGQLDANATASSKNNIRDILGPTLLSPTASDITLLDARMATTGGKEDIDLPETSVSAMLKLPSAPSQSEQNSPAIKNFAAAAATNDAPSKLSKGEGKKSELDGASLKRKRESERLPSQAVANSRELVYTIGLLLPELPVRLFFSVELDTRTQSSTLGLRSNGSTSSDVLPSKAVVEVTVHNLKNGPTEEVLGPVYSTIQYSEGCDTKWIDCVPGRVVCVVGNARYCAVGIHNGDLLVLSSDGRRLFPVISVMECSMSESPYLLVILGTGELKIWDLAERRLVLSNSLEAITTNGPEQDRKLTLLRCQVTTKGIPLITFAESNSETKGHSSLLSYTFDLAMYCWYECSPYKALSDCTYKGLIDIICV
ncbi:hypothetical protein PsorP6_013608 [Peronosclerospora sorghi]|uniref:Uncharacterized protein n=1 Tax=Peronosclerospora sorghi TaxID=230839 RepID=A0ACC0VHN5_9STRA|nr:hypothetical protein PsorP6_013608 [Peronosclerospora sorghi]